MASGSSGGPRSTPSAPGARPSIQRLASRMATKSSAPRRGGGATFRSKSIPVGLHSVFASYLGSAGFKASTSKTLKTTVVAGTRIDVMVVYTPLAVADMGSFAAMAKRVSDSVLGTNTAFWNSRIPVSVRLVYSGEVNYTETGSLDTDLTR